MAECKKISLNVSKTEMVIFKLKRKIMDFSLKTKLNEERLYQNNLVIDLGIKIDSKLNWKTHIDAIAINVITYAKPS